MATTPKLISQLFKLPLRAFIFSLEMFVQTAQGLQKLAYQSIDSMLGAEAPLDVDEPAGINSFTNRVMPSGIIRTANDAINEADSSTVSPGVLMVNGTVSQSATTTPKEGAKMRDANLNDDMLKLVRFKVLFVKRDYEVAFEEDEELVHENMNDTAYTAWKIAEFIQGLDETEVPKKKWGGGADEKLRPKYPKYAEYKNGKWMIHKLDEDDKKYFRVFFEVLERYPREKFKHEERQIEVLEEIRDTIKIKKA